MCELCESANETYRLVAENTHAFCIVCQDPLKEGHVMVLPRRHVVNIGDLSEIEAKEFTDLISKVTDLLEKSFDEDVVVFQNRGRHSSERHVHFHVIPSKGNLRKLISSYERVEERKSSSKEVMQSMRDKIWVK